MLGHIHHSYNWAEIHQWTLFLYLFLKLQSFFFFFKLQIEYSLFYQFMTSLD